MKIVVIHGQKHFGSTRNLTKLLVDKITREGDEIHEYNANEIPYCVGCFTCILQDETKCPHRNVTDEIIRAIEAADVVVAESPNYCMGMTGQLKAFFDHMAFRWFSHRPLMQMKQKIAVAVSTTAGMGAGSVTKQIKQQFFWWGIPATYQIAVTVAAASWADVKPKTRAKIEKITDRTANKILKKIGKTRWSIAQRFIFKMMGNMQRANFGCPKDKQYWLENGWIKAEQNAK